MAENFHLHWTAQASQILICSSHSSTSVLPKPNDADTSLHMIAHAVCKNHKGKRFASHTFTAFVLHSLWHLQPLLLRYAVLDHKSQMY